MQSVAFLEPSCCVRVFVGQFIGYIMPFTGQYVFIGHGLHGILPFEEYCPGWQGATGAGGGDDTVGGGGC